MIFGLNKSQILGKTLGAFVNVDYLITFKNKLVQAFSVGHTVHWELLLNTNVLGLWVQADFRLNNIGNLCFEALTNISERKQAEDQLRLSSTIYESLNDAIIVVDINGFVIAINPSFTRVTWYSSADCIGKHSSQLKSDWQNNLFFD